MDNSDEILIAFYKARQKKLDEIEAARGPLSEWETQNEPTIDFKSAKPFLNDPSETLEEEQSVLTGLVERGLFDPVGSRDTRGMYGLVKFNASGIKQAEELLQQ